MKKQFAGSGKPASATNGGKEGNIKGAKNTPQIDVVSSPKNIEEMEAAILKQVQFLEELKNCFQLSIDKRSGLAIFEV